MPRKILDDQVEYINHNYHKSIDQISKELHIGRTTAYYYVSSAREKFESEDEKQSRLKGFNTARCIAGGKSRSFAIQSAGKLLAEEIFNKNKYDQKFIIGLNLYWAEGSKGGNFSFSNTDYRMLQFMITWVNKYLIDKRIVVIIRIPLNTSIETCKQYWSEKLKNIEFANHSVSKNTKFEYGVCSLEVRGIIGCKSFIKELMDLNAEYLENIMGS